MVKKKIKKVKKLSDFNEDMILEAEAMEEIIEPGMTELEILIDIRDKMIARNLKDMEQICIQIDKLSK